METDIKENDTNDKGWSMEWPGWVTHHNGQKVCDGKCI